MSMAAWADGPGRIESKRIGKDVALTADPQAPHWKTAKAVIADRDRYGKPVAGHRTEIRSLWSGQHLYLLFVCPYDELYLKPQPSTTTETNKLWDWDVAEAFIGADFEKIHRYREFQVSPQGEWVDLDIDRMAKQPANGWKWNSGYTVKARIDKDKKIWYGEMKIPIGSIDTRPPKVGNEMRINLYRIQGPMPDRTHIAWQPVNAESYHTPEAFGRLVLVQ
jgi:hypothetical protein